MDVTKIKNEILHNTVRCAGAEVRVRCTLRDPEASVMYSRSRQVGEHTLLEKQRVYSVVNCCEFVSRNFEDSYLQQLLLIETVICGRLT